MSTKSYIIWYAAEKKVQDMVRSDEWRVKGGEWQVASGRWRVGNKGRGITNNE